MMDNNLERNIFIDDNSESNAFKGDNLERNVFIMDNYDSLQKICTSCAKSVRRTFPNASLEDLRGYAMVGAIHAIDRADFNNPGCLGYIRFYAASHALHGAMAMYGLKRRRRPGKDSVSVIIPTDPDDLITLQERHQKYSNTPYFTGETSIIQKIDSDILIENMEDGLVKQILRLVQLNKTIDEIAEHLVIPRRTVSRILRKMCNTFSSLS